MTFPFWIAFTTAFAAIASGFATGLVTEELRRRAVLDHPNERSSHAIPVPRGGGIGLMAGVIVVWVGIALYSWEGDWAYLIGQSAPLIAALLLAAVSFVDDLRDLPPLSRLLAQIVAVAGMLWYGGDPERLAFQGLLPVWLDYLAVGFAWVWFINLFNFMDGIDGMAGVETAVIGLGAALVMLAADAFTPAAIQGAILAGAGLGFLWWNWQPAKVFLGDVGSVSLGFLLGWVLIQLAWTGMWHAVIILPLYFWCDGTGTLLRRMARREKVWRPHRQHIYQRAVGAGWTHARVSSLVAVCGAALVVCVVAAEQFGGAPTQRVAAVFVAAVAVGATALLVLRLRPGAAPADG